MSQNDPDEAACFEAFVRRMEKLDEEAEERARANGFESRAAEEKASRDEWEKMMGRYTEYRYSHPELFDADDFFPGDKALRPETPEEWSLCDCEGERCLCQLTLASCSPNADIRL